jgi:aspartyl-tRNA(Asn)/glutamyl-tRNA(Gln) amidotransferase subunit A
LTLWQRSATDIIAKTRSGELSAEETTRGFADRIEALDPKVGAFLDRMTEPALARARELDALPAAERGALHGLPIALKDIISVAGSKCTCGSRILENYVPVYNATVVERLHDAGAVVLGKTNMDEFAMGSSTENSAFHTTKNPWNLDCVPGGSSGGSAAAVAARLVPAALGTDTGGSIRQPASLCGVTGLKPTYGRVSRYGLVAFASSLDQIGPLTHSVEDAAVLLEVLAGDDVHDATCATKPASAYSRELEGDIGSLRLGIPAAATSEGVDSDVRAAFEAAVATFESLGAATEEVALPATEHAVACYYLLATAEASSNLARYDGVRYGLRVSANAPLREMMSNTRAQGFGAEVKRRILLGTFVLSSGYYDAYYEKAQRVRSLIGHDFDKAFESVDAVLLPTSPTPAFRIGDKVDDPLSMYLTDIFTITANLTGAPALSFPAGFASNGLPIGVQLVGKHFDESTLLRLGHAFQTATDFHEKTPPLARTS